ncbi:hypothetical protein [Mucilaginibacter sp. SJ]|jgi:predicted transcriptional regulator|uniref:hypothetical protein n=1 Tax=Mucilaginibacter sp. SJ TaxID=3029053 RepID=UPI0023A9F82E|nr:hypothetical protein [Mucilaginibacter sp. SJ]WDZ99987.1 hypothetical protein MusilaSJ_21255 [Mucilaginibacter sp. SJ]
MAEKINHTRDWWENLSEAQKQHIDEGIADAENGRKISSKEFWDKLKGQNEN